MSDRAKFLDHLNVYEFECELPGSGQIVKFKPLTTGQLKSMLAYENKTSFTQQEEAIDKLILSTITSEDFNIDDLYLEDRAFLLIEIRKKTRGEVIEFTNTCSECGSQTLNRVDMNDMPVRKKPDEIDDVVYLNDDISVKLKHITRGEQKHLRPNIGKNKTETQEVAEIQIHTLACGIVSVTTSDGEETDLTLRDRVFLLENIPTSQFEIIKNWFDDNSFGIQFVYTVNCNSCSRSQEVDVPLDNFFFQLNYSSAIFKMWLKNNIIYQN